MHNYHWIIRCTAAVAFALTAQFIIPAAAGDAAAPTTATDELTHRINLAADRLLHGTEPTFTPEFILADVASTRTVGRRRFDNFHGDLSGRYLSAIVQLPRDQHPANFQQLIRDLITHQQPDGRFGRASLAFTPAALGGEHMALLWGNGRLLVGLLDAYAAYPDDATLTAAVRLGDFFLLTIDVCSTPEAVERLKDLKAHGYICFTQLTEGLAMLAERTGDTKYADAARKIYPWLPPRATQHSHGYLTTLRGVMMLYDFQRQHADLAFVEKHYADLVSGPDYMPFGGVNEYFGSFKDHKDNLRDEGCSEADFLGLSLQLWKATGKLEYLERAEHCLVNELSFNQFANGDFGHHYLNNTHGYRLGDQNHKAWWCCTMHGLRYLAEVKNHCITRHEGWNWTDPDGRHQETTRTLYRVNFLSESTFEDDLIGLRLFKDQPMMDTETCTLEVTKATSVPVTLAVRNPWPQMDIPQTEVLIKGVIRTGISNIAGYEGGTDIWNVGDKVTIMRRNVPRIVTPDGRTIALDKITTTTQGYLFNGPYLLGADGYASPGFLSEPVNNIIYANTARPAPEDSNLCGFRQDAHLIFDYTHNGFPGTWQVRLRPMGDLTFHPHRTWTRTLLTFAPEP